MYTDYHMLLLKDILPTGTHDEKSSLSGMNHMITCNTYALVFAQTIKGAAFLE